MSARLGSAAFILLSFLGHAPATWSAGSSSSAGASSRPASAPPLGTLPSWWNGLARHNEVPAYPAPFRHSTYQSKVEGAPLQDLQNTQEVVLPLVQVNVASVHGNPPLRIPAGTRWVRVSEGYGRGSSPRNGGHLDIRYQLEPCPAAFPRIPGHYRLDPQLTESVLQVSLTPDRVARCEINVWIYGPRFRDSFSRKWADSMTPIPRVVNSSNPTPSISDRLDPLEASGSASPSERGSAPPESPHPPTRDAR
jgi:hypothetical protein